MQEDLWSYFTMFQVRCIRYLRVSGFGLTSACIGVILDRKGGQSLVKDQSENGKGIWSIVGPFLIALPILTAIEVYYGTLQIYRTNSIGEKKENEWNRKRISMDLVGRVIVEDL